MRKFTILSTLLSLNLLIAQSYLSYGTLNFSSNAGVFSFSESEGLILTMPNAQVGSTANATISISYNNAVLMKSEENPRFKININDIVFGNLGEQGALKGNNCPQFDPNTIVFDASYINTSSFTVMFMPKNRNEPEGCQVGGGGGIIIKKRQEDYSYPGTSLVTGKLQVLYSIESEVDCKDCPPKRTESESLLINLKGQGTEGANSIVDAKMNTALFSPNPATDQINVNGFAEIFDVLGNKVAEGEGNIILSGLKTGVYMVKTSKGTQRMFKK